VMQVQFSPFLPFYFTSSEVWYFLLSWKSTLRNLLGFFLFFWGVLQVDPELSRTVIVSTKLDTRIPQFASRADVELFLRPPQRLLDRNILSGAPFFTSVPSGRVGSNRDSVYQSNDHFREVCIYIHFFFSPVSNFY
jgi:hypothetical protein